MTPLHIVQGGIANGDKKRIERAALNRLDVRGWVVPKHAVLGDDVVIYIRGFGFFATARIKSLPKPRVDWPNRYGADLTGFELIEPAISLFTIASRIPALTWAIYPRSITTPGAKVAAAIRKLIFKRREGGTPDLDDESLAQANIDELRRVALLAQKASVLARISAVLRRAGSVAIKLYVLRRADGICEGCDQSAPFPKADGTPYLEPHHTHRLADDGPDHPAHVIALCPNCHRRAHHAADSKAFNSSLIKYLTKIESRH